MTGWMFILRSLWFYRRTHWGTLLGAATGTAVLLGALLVGDSMRHSLDGIATSRLGRTALTLESGSRTFRAELADALAAELGTDVAPALKATGMASTEGGERQRGQIQVLGVDRRFWSLGGASDPLAGAGPGVCAVNETLAAELHLTPGDELTLRVPPAAWLGTDLPFSAAGRNAVPLRARVKAILSPQAFGRFDLRINQVPPRSVFLPLDTLAKALGSPDRANVLLAAGRPDRPLPQEEAQAALGRCWQLADAGLSFRELPDGAGLELSTDRVFLEEPVEKAVLAAQREARPILSWFVNSLEHAGRRTPYSFVAAPGEPLIPAGTADDEIILNEWLARDLAATPGARITVSYFILGPSRKLEEKSAVFKVKEVVPLAGAAADPGLAPIIPGLAEAGSCREWDPGIPIDTGRIREKDEEYWKANRGTPKAFVTLAAARRLWSNPFGSATAIRFSQNGVSMKDQVAAILRRLPPDSVGLRFRSARQEGARAAAEAVDFSGLFAGFSFTLLASALILTVLLFTLGIEQRSAETGVLRAVGFLPGRIRRLRLAEGAGIALLGGLAGIPLGIAYCRATLWMLGTVWRGATGSVTVELHLRLSTVLAGTGLGIAAALLAIALASGRQLLRPIRLLLSGDIQIEPGATLRRGGARYGIPALIAFLLTLAILFIVLSGGNRGAVGAFWVGGFLTLAGCLFLARWLLGRLAFRPGVRPPGMIGLGIRNAARRPGRSEAAIALLAIGIWVVISVGANRRGAAINTGQRSSGTGGFAFYGETTLPVPFDLNNPAARQRLGIGPAQGSTRLVTLRVRDGDDASCLNLNRVGQPRLLGADTEELAGLGAFAAARVMPGRTAPFSWRQLDVPLDDGTIPAVADERVIIWGLGMQVGDTLTVTDERGETIRLRLIAGLNESLFQGSVLLSIRNFSRHFPSVSGARVLLVDAPPAEREALRDTLNRTLHDAGLELVPAAERLAVFRVVEDTYLSVFLALGGLGLIIGTAGMGVILLRNALERRGEMAILRSVGFTRASIGRMLLAENGLLLGCGMLAGIVAAAVAVLPTLLTPGAEIPFAFVAGLLALIAANGALWSFLAARFATRGALSRSLRSE